MMEGLRIAMNELSPTADPECEALCTAASACAELQQVLQTLRRDAETTVAAAIARQTPDHSAADANAAAASTIADLERQNAELREAKDREVAGLNSEVKRLKAAIGQLVGVAAAT